MLVPERQKKHVSGDTTSKKEKGFFFQEEKLPEKERKPHQYLLRLLSVCGMLQGEQGQPVGICVKQQPVHSPALHSS